MIIDSPKLKIMTARTLYYALVISIIFILSCTRTLTIKDPEKKDIFYHQGTSNRMAAEWEPALGTLIAWPLSIPYKLVVALASDHKLFTLVESETSKNEATKWYLKWGIDLEKVTFITAPQGIDVSWVRDWGPHAIFTPESNMKLADGKYIFATPISNQSCTDSLYFIYMDGNKIIKTETDDNATVYVGQQLNFPVVDLPFISTGGNVMTDGLGSAFSSCVLTNENRYYGIPDDKFFLLNKSLLGFQQYHILSNFEQRGIQHVDCLMKLLDEERMLVLQPPSDHDLFPLYENIVNNELSKLKNPYGRPYKIERMNTYRFDNEKLAAYSNSLILNKIIYVPLYNIREDSLALKRWRALMPGYAVKGFNYVLKDEPAITQQVLNRYKNIGWTDGDALHCRTRAIWNPEMLYITVKVLGDTLDQKDSHKIYATVIDYSGKGLINDKVNVYWKEKGHIDWKITTMKNAGSRQHFEADIPKLKSGTIMEYFIEAASKSGQKERRPSTAPSGTYTSIFK